MNAGLAKEPLVAISCRLLAQAPNAVMLPERVASLNARSILVDIFIFVY